MVGTLKKGTHNDAQLYQSYLEGKWRCNLSDPMQWVDSDSIAFSFHARKNTTMNNIITINDVHVN